MEYQGFLCIFQNNSAMATLGLKAMRKFLWEGKEKVLPCWLSQFRAELFLYLPKGIFPFPSNVRQPQLSYFGKCKEKPGIPFFPQKPVVRGYSQTKNEQSQKYRTNCDLVQPKLPKLSLHLCLSRLESRCNFVTILAPLCSKNSKTWAIKREKGEKSEQIDRRIIGHRTPRQSPPQVFKSAGANSNRWSISLSVFFFEPPKSVVGRD